MHGGGGEGRGVCVYRETYAVSNGASPREPTVDRGTNGEREPANELEGRSGAVENGKWGESESWS